MPPRRPGGVSGLQRRTQDRGLESRIGRGRGALGRRRRGIRVGLGQRGERGRRNCRLRAAGGILARCARGGRRRTHAPASTPHPDPRADRDRLDAPSPARNAARIRRRRARRPRAPRARITASESRSCARIGSQHSDRAHGATTARSRGRIPCGPRGCELAFARVACHAADPGREDARMTPRERVWAALSGGSLDRPPVSFWGHCLRPRIERRRPGRAPRWNPSADTAGTG